MANILDEIRRCVDSGVISPEIAAEMKTAARNAGMSLTHDRPPELVGIFLEEGIALSDDRNELGGPTIRGEIKRLMELGRLSPQTARHISEAAAREGVSLDVGEDSPELVEEIMATALAETEAEIFAAGEENNE